MKKKTTQKWQERERETVWRKSHPLMWPCRREDIAEGLSTDSPVLGTEKKPWAGESLKANDDYK